MTEPTVIPLLLDCLHQDPSRADRARLASLADDDWRQLFALAAGQKVGALLAFRLRTRGLDDAMPASIRASLREANQRAAVRSLRVQGCLFSALTALRTNGVDVIVLKGSHLASVVYPDPALRHMVDIDLLVRARDLGRAARALGSAGYEPSVALADGTDLSSTLSSYPYHLPPFVRRGAPNIELHWRLSPPGERLLPDTLWERAVRTRVAGVDALGLSAEDLLLHLCAHASYKHGFELGLRPSCDIAEAVRHWGGALDWPALSERARRCGWQRGAYLSLRLARDMLGAAVPDCALAELRPRGLTEALVGAARFVTLQDDRTNRSIPPSLATMSEARTWRGRAAEVMRRVFAPRLLVAEHYRLPPRSLRVLFYYPVRMRDLLRRHSRVAARLWRGDAELTHIAGRKATIQRWLAEDGALDTPESHS